MPGSTWTSSRHASPSSSTRISNFLEEVAKFRAARRMWARIMRDQFGAKNPRSWMLRFHTQTAGSTLTAQQPENNIVRTALQALAAVLGGTQSLHTNSYDEALALPTEQAVRIALRTQQIIAYESGVAQTIDPLAGSYYVESLTNEIEKHALGYLDKIDAMGGMLKAIERGFVQQEIQNAAYEYQQAVDRLEQVVVGVNRFEQEQETLDRNSAPQRRSGAAAGGAPARTARPPRPGPVGGFVKSGGGRRPLRRQPDARHHHRRGELRHRGRDQRHAAKGVWGVQGSGGDLGDTVCRNASSSNVP